MTVVGIDLNTRQLDLVALTDDNHATYLPCPYVSHKPPFETVDIRNIRPRLNEVITAWSQDGWDAIRLVGVEKPYAQGRGTAYTYGLIVGAILATVPRRIPVLELPPNDRLFGWKALSVGKTNASKDDVREWAVGQLDDRAALVADGLGCWPQDAFDAYCLAYAVRELNGRAQDAAA